MASSSSAYRYSGHESWS